MHNYNNQNFPFKIGQNNNFMDLMNTEDYLQPDDDEKENFKEFVNFV